VIEADWVCRTVRRERVDEHDVPRAVLSAAADAFRRRVHERDPIACACGILE
jgi:hypothetical protein